MRSALCFFLLVFSSLAGAEDFTIQTFAGGGIPQNIQGTSAALFPAGIVTDASGNVYFTAGNAAMRLDSNGVLTLMAGNGTPGFSGDGGLATNAQLLAPTGIAIDGRGNLYIADSGNARIRMVQNGVISTFAGGGTQTADNVSATDALIGPGHIAVDAAGNVYVEDGTISALCCRIRKISNGVITTIAGNGTLGHSGDGGPATSAQLGHPGAMALDAAGTLYFFDSPLTPKGPIECGCYFRKIRNGVITTVATTAYDIGAIAVDPAGNILIATGAVVQEISNGVITTIAGTQLQPPDGSVGDNGPAIDAYLGGVNDLSVDKAGNIYVAAYAAGNGHPVPSALIRKISNGVITTVAGNITGVGVWTGDGGSPVGAKLSLGGNGNGENIVIGNIVMDTEGNVYVSESNRVRKISQGVITTVAGMELPGFSGDNGPAVDAQLNNPQGLGVDAAGNLYIADTNNGRVRKVSNGIITTIAGGNEMVLPYSGDGAPATSVGVYPQGLAVSPTGDVYVSQNGFQIPQVVLKISNGIVATVAGNGSQGYSGDGGPARQAQLAYPSGLALDKAGNLYIADTANRAIRMVSNGAITTVAGGTHGSSSGDGGPAMNATLTSPNGIAVDALGRLYISENSSSTWGGMGDVRRVSNGVITTVAGDGISYFTGDGGPAVGASMSPIGLAIGPHGQVYEADGNSSRVRVLTPVPIPGVSFSANPAAVPTNTGSTLGLTTLSWNAPGYSSLQIFANAALFDDVGTSGSVATGNWVSNGMNFSLVDRATGSPLSTVTVHTTAAASGGQISFTANPSPIALVTGASVGKTTLSWNAAGYSGLQVWVNGVLFDAGLPASGSVDTGNWVSDGTSFSLVDPATSHAIAMLTVHTTSVAGGQATFMANPNPITLAGGTNVGKTTLSWNAPGHSQLQIWVDGVLFDAGLPASGSVDTGNWVSDGTTFALIDPANGQTIASVSVAAK